jgi:hypothetical protein
MKRPNGKRSDKGVRDIEGDANNNGAQEKSLQLTSGQMD